MKYFACAGLVLAFLPGAWAEPPEAGVVVAEVAQVEPEASKNQSSPEEAPLDLDALSDLRGGEAIAIQHTNQTLTATNSGNTINGNSIDSGAMNINANAFNGYDGIGNFVINTGHNNNLMGSVSVNVMVTPQ